jgi:hypothetical protein
VVLGVEGVCVVGVGLCGVLLEDVVLCGLLEEEEEDLDVVGVCGCLLKEDEEVDEESEAKRGDGVTKCVGVDEVLVELVELVELVCVDVVGVDVVGVDVVVWENFILFLGSGNVFHSSFHPSSPGCNLIH